MSSFSWGHIWIQIVSGLVAKRYGPKYYLPGAITIASICILLIPPLGEHIGYQAIIALRAVEGAMHGVLFPCVHYLLSKWAPIAERAKWGSFVYAGKKRQ